MDKYYSYLYGAFASVGILGIISRVFYTFQNGEYPSRNLLKNTFTRIKLIDSNMLTIPLIVQLTILINLLLIRNKVNQNQLIQSNKNKSKSSQVLMKQLLPKWLASYTVFYFIWQFDIIFLQKRFGYDPSGHYLCGIVAYSNWLNIIITLKQYYKKEENQLTTITTAIGGLLVVYQLYCLFFAAFVYHHYSEVLFGIINGIVVSKLCIQNDVISDNFYYILQFHKVSQ